MGSRKVGSKFHSWVHS